MEVVAPNGDTYDLPEAVATGLVASEGAGWSLPSEEPAAKRARRPKSD